MIKFAGRLLALAIFATPLMALPLVTQANAATSNGKHVKKHATRIQRAASPVRDVNRSPFPSNYSDDFDRKSSGGGGGY